MDSKLVEFNVYVSKAGLNGVILLLYRRFDYILLPIAKVCVEASQRGAVDFDSFFTHTICHECCHGIGPHNIVTPDGRESTVRLVSLPSHFVYIFTDQYVECLQSGPADMPVSKNICGPVLTGVTGGLLSN